MDSSASNALASELQAALAPILLNQPANPLLHLMSHFREKAGLPGTSPVSSAYRILRLCPANSQHCEGNIMSAFSTLGAATQGQVTAAQFGQLLDLLVAPLMPEELQQHMAQVAGQLSRLSPDFATFRAATKACMLLEQLCVPDATRTPSDQMFQAAEARKLLTHLLTEQQWFTALQPLPEAPTVVTMSATAAAGAVERQQEAIEQEAARLVGLVLSDGS